MAMTVSELQVKVTADTKDAESGLSALGTKIGSAGGMLATAFGAAAIGGIAALGAGLTASVAAASTFEAKMSAVKAVSGATAGEMEQLSGLALKLGKETSFSASEAAEGIGELVKAGVSIGDVMGGAAAASLNLAAAGGIKVGEAAEIASNAMNVFNLKGSEMGHVADVIAGAANASAIDVTDFKMSLAASGSVAATVGIGFEDLATAIAVMGQAGIKGSDAGTSLKTMMLNLSPSTDKAAGVMKELGIITADGANRFFDATGKARGMSEIAGVLANATRGLTEQQKLQALQTMFGTDAIRAAAIMAKAGAEGFDEMAASIGKVTAADVAKERLNNLKGSVEQLLGSLETAGIMLGTMLLPGLKSMVDGLTEWVNTGIDIIEKLPSAWASAVAIFEGTANTADLSVVSEMLDRAFGKTVTDAIVANIARLGDAWRTVQQAFAGDWSPSDQIDPIVNAAGKAASAVKALGDTLSDAIAKAEAMGAWENVATGFSNLADVAGLAIDRLDDITAALGRAQGPAGRTAGAADVLAAAIKGAALGFQYSTMVIQDFVDMIGTAISVSIDFATAMSRTGEALLRLQRGDLPGAVTALGEAKDAFGAGMQAAEDFRQRGVLAVADETKIMAQVVGVQLTATRAAVESNMSAANAAVSEGSAGWQREMEANGVAMTTAAQTSMAGVATATETGMAEAVATVAAAAAPAAAAAEAMGTGMAAGIEAAAPQMAAAAEQGASSAVSAVQGQQGAASAAGQSVGDSLGSGMQSGILGWVGSIAAAAANLVSSAIGAARAEADAHSPSKKTEKLGEDMAEGLEIGLSKSKLGEEMQAKIRDFIQASRDYIPVAGEIKRVEQEIATIRDKSQTDALFRAEQMITIDSEVLRLKEAQVRLERDLVPLRQDLARATREVTDIERGSLSDRTRLIEMDGERKSLRLQEIDLEKQLIGLDSGSKKAKSIQEQIDKLRDTARALDLEAEKTRLTNDVAATAARVKKEALDDQARGQQAVIDRIKDQIDVLGAEQAVFVANENVIKNATDNEIAYRNRLIAVFRSEGQPLADRITAGLALVAQLEKEGRISKELADKLRDVAKEAGVSSEKTAGLGTAAETAAPQMDAAAKKAAEMAAQAKAIAEQAGAAKEQMSELAKEAAEYARKRGSLFDPRPRTDSAGASGAASAMVDAAGWGGVTAAYQPSAVLPVMSDGGGLGPLQRIQIDVTMDGNTKAAGWIEGYQLLYRRGGLPATFGGPA